MKNNFNIGLRSSAIRGFDFEIAGFHQIIKDYQYGDTFTDGGDRVWFGKILGRGGRTIGIARGTFTPSDDPATPGGTFAGRILVRPDVEGGVIAGHYLPGRPATVGGSDLGDARIARPGAAGFFEGRWAIGCTDSQ